MLVRDPLYLILVPFFEKTVMCLVISERRTGSLEEGDRAVTIGKEMTKDDRYELLCWKKGRPKMSRWATLATCPIKYRAATYLFYTAGSAILKCISNISCRRFCSECCSVIWRDTFSKRPMIISSRLYIPNKLGYPSLEHGWNYCSHWIGTLCEGKCDYLHNLQHLFSKCLKYVDVEILLALILTHKYSSLQHILMLVLAPWTKYVSLAPILKKGL